MDVPEEFAAQVREHLLVMGGLQSGKAVGPSERWRVRLRDATFTYYARGTLYSTASPSQDPSVWRAWTFIDSGVSPRFLATDRDLLIGLDETGKSEPIGHLVLAGALVPRVLDDEVERIVGLAETKKKHPDTYWDQLFFQLDELRPRGFHYRVEKVPPSDTDEHKLNALMDASYERILNHFFSGARPEACRVVLDNYNLGPVLHRSLEKLKEQGAEVVVEYRADDSYIETRAASVVAKHERIKEIRALNGDPRFWVSGLSVGSGSTRETKEWLHAWKASGKTWPWFVRRSYAAIRALDGPGDALTQT